MRLLRWLLGVVAAPILTVAANPSLARSDADGGRERAAKELAAQIQKAGLHRVYVTDFLSPSGKREFGGCYFASLFSTKIAKHAHDFSIVNRIEAQKALAELNMPPQSSQTPDGVAKLSQALGVDGLLLGTVVAAKGHAKIAISMRDASSNKEVWTMEFDEALERGINGNWPQDAVPGSEPIYFSGLDGVSIPRCISCPNPDFTNKARQAKFNGIVLTSATVDATGRIKQIWIISDPGFDLAQHCVEVIKTWRLEPAKDSAGKAVEVTVPVETKFELR
ncbi:MAG: hypothetical protein NVS9B14_21860 [Candidatus Acidiferrum sp.]